MNIKCFVQGDVETDCYVVYDDSKKCVLIDCDGNVAPILNFIEKNGLDLTHILLTHGHHDHVGSVNDILANTSCKVCIGKNDEELLDSPQKSFSFHNFKKVVADIILNDGDIITSGNMSFKVMETPGHTKGGVCYICDDAIFSGDTMFQRNCGRVDFYGGDWEKMKTSLKKIVAIPGDYNVYPGHGPSTTLAEERIYNPYVNS